ncbi:MAG: hypothetical protein R3199_01325 [Gemmatimonadota bacterium]|nr:hypothetical protein [Gemmatimonadota bacterium]
MREETTRPGLARTSEGGFAVAMVLVVLVCLGMIAAAATMMTATDIKLSGLYTFSSAAGAAATAGLEHAAGHFVTNGSDTGWPVTGSTGGYDYTVTISRDVHDFGTGETFVWHDKDLGYNGLGIGDPVWVLVSTATRGDIRAVQRMRITPRSLTVEAQSALQSNSGVSLHGNITVSGINTRPDGTQVDPSDTSVNGVCDENKPAIRMTDDEDVTLQGTPDLYGNETYADNDPPYVQYDDSVVWHTPEEVLGLQSGALDSYKQSGEQYGTNRPDTLSGIVYVTDDFGSTGACATDGGCGNIQGSGILIIHNPLYNPREHDPEDPMYDPEKASDPAYAPANMGNINGGTFKGIIIADKINKINGNVDIYGAIMSLTEVEIDMIGAGTAEIFYSCQSIEQVESTIVDPVRLSWVAD